MTRWIAAVVLLAALGGTGASVNEPAPLPPNPPAGTTTTAPPVSPSTLPDGTYGHVRAYPVDPGAGQPLPGQAPQPRPMTPPVRR